MKKILTIIGVVALLAAVSQAQTSITNITQFTGGTNWAAIPYLAYDIGTKKFGGGGVLLYKVTDNFWAGVRAQSINRQTTAAGVQAQLQATITWSGLKVTPFIEASTGMGNSSMYANGGTGALISFGQWNINKHATLAVGVIGDYEHYVYGSRNGNQVNAGPFIRLNF